MGVKTGVPEVNHQPLASYWVNFHFAICTILVEAKGPRECFLLEALKASKALRERIGRNAQNYLSENQRALQVYRHVHVPEYEGTIQCSVLSRTFLLQSTQVYLETWPKIGNVQ